MCPHDDEIMKDIRYLQETMERLLSDFSSLKTPLVLAKESVWRPLTDVYETDRELVIRMDVAGMDQQDFDLTLSGRVLTIRGVRRDPTPTAKKHFHKMEISLGPFERNIEVPARLQISSLEAHYDNGYLLVRIGKGAKRCSQREWAISVERG
jgi:HSP20 family protein